MKKPSYYVCPICGKYKFNKNGNYDICKHCGWENDNVMNDDPTFSGGANDLCLNDYKSRYEAYIKINPQYIWKIHGYPEPPANEDLKSKLEILFNQNFFSDEFDPEGEFPEIAQELLYSYSWKDIYSMCFEHFTNKCVTADELYNALNLYYIYSFIEQPIPNPYELIGYILFRIDIEQDWDKYGEFIDTFTISILDKSLGSTLMTNGYYRTWEDPKTIEAIELWKNKYE